MSHDRETNAYLPTANILNMGKFVFILLYPCFHSILAFNESFTSFQYQGVIRNAAQAGFLDYEKYLSSSLESADVLKYVFYPTALNVHNFKVQTPWKIFYDTAHEWKSSIGFSAQCYESINDTAKELKRGSQWAIRSK